MDLLIRIFLASILCAAFAKYWLSIRDPDQMHSSELCLVGLMALIAPIVTLISGLLIIYLSDT